ncbi:hypothetical protein Tco_0138854 [Tanacetum coccineum]
MPDVVNILVTLLEDISDNSRKVTRREILQQSFCNCESYTCKWEKLGYADISAGVKRLKQDLLKKEMFLIAYAGPASDVPVEHGENCYA